MIHTLLCWILGALIGSCSTFGAGTTISTLSSGTSTLPGVLNVTQANSTSTFSGGLTSKSFSVFDTAYFGGTATSTFSSAGILTLNANNTAITPLLEINQDSSGDATILLSVPATTWYLGLDNSDLDKFRIGTTSNLLSPTLELSTNGSVSLGGGVSGGNFGGAVLILDRRVNQSNVNSSNPISDLNDPDDYQLTIMNSAGVTGSSTGICFAGSSSFDNCGASIIHETTGTNSKGTLNFYTKRVTTGAANPTLALSLTDTGRLVFTEASSTLQSIFDRLYVGGTATTTISSDGTLQIPSSAKLGIGTTTPWGALSIMSNTNPSFIVSTSTGLTSFRIDNSGHYYSGGYSPTVSSCGTSPSVSAGSTDHAGKITLGTSIGGDTSCTATFSTVFDRAPSCWVMNESRILFLQAVSTTGDFTINVATTFTDSDVISYTCTI